MSRILAPLLALSLLLSGCAALLDRPYAVVEPHAEHPVTGEDPSTLRAGAGRRTRSGEGSGPAAGPVCALSQVRLLSAPLGPGA